MASGRACLLKQEGGLSIKGEPKEELGFLFKTVILAEKLNFDRVFSSSTASEDKFFAVFYRPNKASRNRIGVSTAKRIVNKATKRNKLKRLIKNSFLSGLRCGRGFDVVVRVKHQASRVADDKILLDSLTSHWQKIMKHATKTSTTNG